MKVEAWDEGHLCWREFLDCLVEAGPEQAPSVPGDEVRLFMPLRGG